MPDCPVCGTPADPDHPECSACGSVLDGATTPFEPVGTPETAMPAAVGEGAALIVRKGPEVGEKFFVDRPEMSLGRDPACDVFLNDITVSRKHAAVKLAGGVASIEDAGSLNGTYVNGMRVDSAVLGDGDVVQIGRFVMAFSAGGEGL